VAPPVTCASLQSTPWQNSSAPAALNTSPGAPKCAQYPSEKTAKPTMVYLDKPEIDALLAAPDRRTEQGARDYAMLLFLYNTGARVDEAAHVTIDDITWGRPSGVRLLGKGNKARHCSLWAQTVEVLKPLTTGRATHERLFLNRLGQPLTRFGILQLNAENCEASRRDNAVA
jgi:integrase/recombinase XerD